MHKPIIFKLFLTGILTILSFRSFSQRPDYNDLKYVLYHNQESTTGYLLKKGFLYTGLTGTPGENFASNYSKNTEDSVSFMSISKKSIDSISYAVSFLTFSNSDYSCLNTQIKSLGFVIEKKEKEELRAIEYFQNGNMEVIIQSTPRETHIIQYYILVADKTKRKNAVEHLKKKPDH